MAFPKIPRMSPEVFEAFFGPSNVAIAKAMGVTVYVVGNWRHRGIIPAHFVERMEKWSGVPKYKIRPDLFKAPKQRKREAA
jgi:hypothetical protein